jgi:hypothetical protein
MSRQLDPQNHGPNQNHLFPLIVVLIVLFLSWLTGLIPGLNMLQTTGERAHTLAMYLVVFVFLMLALGGVRYNFLDETKTVDTVPRALGLIAFALFAGLALIGAAIAIAGL